MKKFLIAAAASLLIFGGQAQAAPVEKTDNQLEIQEQSKWAHFRDKHILNRETENERRDRKDWERRHPDRDYYRHRDRHRDDYYYRDRDRHRDDYYYRDRARYRDDYRYYPPPPRHDPPDRGYNYPPPPRR